MSTADGSKFNALTTGDEVVAAWPERVAHRIFLVTGASPTSIGFTTLTSLAKARPAALILVGRSAAKTSSTAAALRAIDGDIYILEVIADLSSLSSVQAGAEKIINDSRITHVDVMVNNTGIMAGPHEKSVDGIELQFATNHIGHFLLTALLAPKLRASPEGGRIVNVTSAGHRKVNFTRVGDYDPLFERHEYEQWDAYGNSKLANILFTRGLVSQGFEAYSVHPGSTPTTNLGERIKSDIGPAVAIFATVPDMEPFEPMKSLEQGPNTQLVAALRPESELPKGAYLWQCQVATPSEYARDEGGVLTKRLWEVSERVVRRKFE